MSAACRGGGETPALAGVVESGTIDLGASCTGIVQPKSRLSLGTSSAAGDAIVLLASSGIHANGVSLPASWRAAAGRLSDRYGRSGQAFGEAILAPTVLYVHR